MADFKVNKTVTATLTYMDLIRIANALDDKATGELEKLGSIMGGTARLQESIQEMLQAISK